MAVAKEVIQGAVERYDRERDRFIKLAGRVADLCRAAMDENAVRAQVTSRTKTLRSFEGKLNRFAKRDDKNYQTVEDVFGDISDFAGVRIATYQLQDEAKARELVRKIFCGPPGKPMDVVAKDRLEPEQAKFYRSTHCQVYLCDDELLGDYANLRGASCEIQICSMMAHVWNEIEHDIGYKPDGDGPSEAELGLLEALGHLTLAGDAAITRLLAANVVRMTSHQGAFADVHDFVARLRSLFPAADLSVNAGPAFDAAMLLGLDAADKVQAAIGTDLLDAAQAQDEILRFNAFVEGEGQSELTLNGASGDLLLVGLLKASARDLHDLLGASKSTPRATRLASIVHAYLDYRAGQAHSEAGN